jgi:DNA-binding GntR family transcriptional regulator
MARPVRSAVAGRQQRELMRDSAYDLIKFRILSNEYPGGFQILEDQLADEVGMSRTPLKEALLQLESEGLIDIVPRRGIRVRPLTANDVNEIYQVLSSLEVLAADLIASNPENTKAVTALQAEVDRMRAALRRDDLDAWAMADERFHRALVDFSGNGRLATAAHTLLDQSQRFRMFTLRLRDKPVRSTENHAALAKALKSHDAAEARKVHLAHKASWHVHMTELLMKFGIRHI